MFCKDYVFDTPYATFGQQLMLLSKEPNIQFQVVRAVIPPFSRSTGVLDVMDNTRGEV